MDKFTKHLLTWMLWNTIWVSLIVCGAYLGMVFAGNILIFLIWLNVVAAIGWQVMPGNDPAKWREVQDKYAEVPKWFHTFNLWVDIVMAACLVGLGWYWMGGILAASAFTEHGSKDKL